LPCAYEAAGFFKDGFALINDGGTYPNTKYGYINKSGKVVVPLENVSATSAPLRATISAGSYWALAGLSRWAR